jgi:hypothetical protein
MMFMGQSSLPKLLMCNSTIRGERAIRLQQGVAGACDWVLKDAYTPRRYMLCPRMTGKQRSTTAVDGIAENVPGTATTERRHERAPTEDARAGIIDTHCREEPRKAVMAAYRVRHTRFGKLYKKLAE